MWLTIFPMTVYKSEMKSYLCGKFIFRWDLVDLKSELTKTIWADFCMLQQSMPDRLLDQTSLITALL